MCEQQFDPAMRLPRNSPGVQQPGLESFVFLRVMRCGPAPRRQLVLASDGWLRKSAIGAPGGRRGRSLSFPCVLKKHPPPRKAIRPEQTTISTCGFCAPAAPPSETYFEAAQNTSFGSHPMPDLLAEFRQILAAYLAQGLSNQVITRTGCFPPTAPETKKPEEWA